MIDRWFHWQRHGARMALLLRVWVPFQWWNLEHRLWSIVRWRTTELNMRTLAHDQCECYCPEGSTTDLRIAFAGFGVWASLSRSRVKRPCSCDLIVSEWEAQHEA